MHHNSTHHNSLQHERDIMESITLFQGLTPGQLAMVSGVMHRKSFPTGSYILNINQCTPAVYIVLSGTVKICIERPGSPDVIVAICGPGEVLGEINAVDGRGHSANAVTLEPTTCLWIDCRTFLDILKTIPLVSFNLTLNTMRRLRLSTLHAQALFGRNVPGRVAGQLLAFAHEYGQPTGEGGQRIPFRLTQSDLSELVGATRASVNAAVVGFKRSGAIEVDREFRITLLDEASLRRKCC